MIGYLGCTTKKLVKSGTVDVLGGFDFISRTVSLPMKKRGMPFLLLFYFAVLGVAFVLGGFGVTKVVEAAASLSNHAVPEQTLLDEQVKSARAIKDSLARTLPAIERLPPITAKVANSRTETHPIKEAHKVPRLSRKAREALASGDTGGSSWVSYATYDRHAPQ